MRVFNRPERVVGSGGPGEGLRDDVGDEEGVVRSRVREYENGRKNEKGGVGLTSSRGWRIRDIGSNGRAAALANVGKPLKRRGM